MNPNISPESAIIKSAQPSNSGGRLVGVRWGYSGSTVGVLWGAQCHPIDGVGQVNHFVQTVFGDFRCFETDMCRYTQHKNKKTHAESAQPLHICYLSYCMAISGPNWSYLAISVWHWSNLSVSVQGWSPYNISLVLITSPLRFI